MIPIIEAAPRQRSSAFQVFRHPWIVFLARRLLSLVLIIIGLIVATFFLVRLIPGDPAAGIAGLADDPAVVERIREQLGLNLPVWEQFTNYVGGLLRGDLGNSFFTNEPVATILAQRLPPSLTIAGTALLLVMLISVPLGLIMGALTREDRRQKTELGFVGVTSFFGSVPEFLMATMLSLVFAVWLKALPAAGSGSFIFYILPIAAVTIRPIAILARMVRVETLGALTTDFARTAQGKRLPARIMYLRHILPNVVTAALTVGGLLFPGLVGAAVVIENIFAIPGLGTALVTAVIQRNYPVIQGCILMLGLIVVLMNTLVDFLIAAVDPRALTGKV